MSRDKFSYGFFGILAVVIAILAFVFRKVSGIEGVRSAVWSALILLVLIFGVILISLNFRKILKSRKSLKKGL